MALSLSDITLNIGQILISYNDVTPSGFDFQVAVKSGEIINVGENCFYNIGDKVVFQEVNPFIFTISSISYAIFDERSVKFSYIEGFIP